MSNFVQFLSDFYPFFVHFLTGLLAVYKPINWTSSDVVVMIRGILQRGYQIKSGKKCRIKVGHGGTLDPLAEGVLVIGVGRGTKLMEDYLHGTKSYQAVGKLGVETDTYDSTGKITEIIDCSHVTHELIKSCLSKYRGDILQVPPMYSALKRDGKKLYELARKGLEVDREARKVTLYKLDLLTEFDNKAIELPNFGLNIDCSGGFYVRSIIHDIGRDCQTRAHMTRLLRSRQGQFDTKHCLYEPNWNYDALCSHVITTSQLIGLNVDDLAPATS